MTSPCDKNQISCASFLHIVPDDFKVATLKQRERKGEREWERERMTEAKEERKNQVWGLYLGKNFGCGYWHMELIGGKYARSLWSVWENYIAREIMSLDFPRCKPPQGFQTWFSWKRIPIKLPRKICIPDLPSDMDRDYWLEETPQRAESGATDNEG